MRNVRHLVVLLAGIAGCQVAWAQNWELVWQDEFNGSIGPDWVFETGNGSGGWGNNELEYYRRENATVENGNLVITARHEDFGGFHYTSARMKTQGKMNFRYGRIEARIAMPSAAGLWPAFWMLGSDIGSVGWPACGEIDIMEHINDVPNVYGTMHWRNDAGAHQQSGGNTPVDVTSYHVYAIEWDDQQIRWLVDGRQYYAASADGTNGTGAFHQDFFILLNMAVGGDWPGFDVDLNALR